MTREVSVIHSADPAKFLAGQLVAIDAIDPSNSAEGKDGNELYRIRARMIYTAMALATELGFDCGFSIDPNEPDWPVAYIDLPFVGQVSWHMPKFPHEFDGHNSAEKSHRIRRFYRLDAVTRL